MLRGDDGFPIQVFTKGSDSDHRVVGVVDTRERLLPLPVTHVRKGMPWDGMHAPTHPATISVGRVIGRGPEDAPPISGGVVPSGLSPVSRVPVPLFQRFQRGGPSTRDAYLQTRVLFTSLALRRFGFVVMDPSVATPPSVHSIRVPDRLGEVSAIVSSANRTSDGNGGRLRVVMQVSLGRSSVRRVRTIRLVIFPVERSVDSHRYHRGISGVWDHGVRTPDQVQGSMISGVPVAVCFGAIVITTVVRVGDGRGRSVAHESRNCSTRLTASVPITPSRAPYRQPG